MSYQTGTIAKLNDVLNVLATFLTANGWTIYGNWLEPVYVRPQNVVTTVSQDELWWRFARRLHASKSGVYISAQDFFYTYDFSYGTTKGALAGVVQGPGIAVTISTSFNAGSAGVDAGHPYTGYNASGPPFPGFYSQPGVPLKAGGSARTFIMPLPQCISHPLGRWWSGDHVMNPASAISNPGLDATLPAVFGVPAGAAVPMPYWLFCDATGDNVVFVVDRTGVDFNYIQASPYLFFGTVNSTKSGAWTGGPYCGASRGNDNAWSVVLNEPWRFQHFGPPGAESDGSQTTPMVLRVDVDTVVGGYFEMDGNLTSTTVLNPKPPEGVIGSPPAGLAGMTLRMRSSSMANGAPCLPTYWAVKRDSGLYSLVATLPNVYQAKTQGMSVGQDDGSGTVAYFDGFAVRKIP